MTSEIADRIEILWKEEAIRLVFEMRAKLTIPDTCGYFWNNVRRISAPDYVPTEQDILLVRYRTSGILERKFEINKYMFTIMNTGGQRAERKKWPHCYEGTDVVLFVVSLASYDEVMFEGMLYYKLNEF